MKPRLYQLFRRASQAISAKYVENSVGGMNLPQISVLEALVIFGPQTQKVLGERAFIDKASLSTMIFRLRKECLIAFERPKADRRRTIISITPLGIERLETALEALEAAERAVLRQVPALARRPLIAAMTALVSAP